MTTSPGCVQQLVRKLTADRNSIINHPGISALAKMPYQNSSRVGTAHLQGGPCPPYNCYL